MIAIWIWLTVLALILLGAFIATFHRKRRTNEPRVVKGHFLWGSALDFGDHAVKFLQRCQKEYGQIFTIRLLNQYLTIIADPHSYEALTKEKNFDFDHIQKQVNKNVFSFVLKEPRKMIKDTGKTVRGQYLTKGMTAFTSNLQMTCQQVCQNNNATESWTSMGLRSFASHTMFDAIFHTVFGRSLTGPFVPQNIYKNFETYHKYFNYLWLGVPKSMMPSAGKALEGLLCQPTAEELINREDCSDYIKSAVAYMKLQGQTEGEIIGHNLVYLHVNYNTFRLAFWALSNLLEDKEAFDAVKKELDEAVDELKNECTNTSTFTCKDIEGLKTLDSFCQETVRLSSGVFVVRYVEEDTPFTTSDGQTKIVRKGDRVAVYPPAIHKDPEIFEEPYVFKHDRFVDAKFYKYGKEVKQPVIGFGSLCPGKRYAMLQLKWYLMTILSMFDIQSLEGEHAEYDVHCHGHEVLPPIKDVQFRYKLKSDITNLDFN